MNREFSKNGDSTEGIFGKNGNSMNREFSKNGDSTERIFGITMIRQIVI